MCALLLTIFFFQAEDGIRDGHVTGVQTCALPILPGAQPLEHVVLPRRCVLVVGQEGPGVSERILEAADLVVGISQFGSTRSINVAAAAAIAMHSWIVQHADIPRGPLL